MMPPEPVQMLLNDVVFDNYHMFRPEARMLSEYKIVASAQQLPR